MSADLAVRWHLELVDSASARMLRNDRAIRTSLQQTQTAQNKLERAATQTGQAQVRGSTQGAAALVKEGRAAVNTQRDVATLNRAQAEALSVGSRLASSARSVADSYRAQATAARQATTAERARSSAQRAGSRLATGAASTGAGLTRGTQTALAAAAGGGILAKTIGTFAGFEQQMDRVLAVSGATDKQFRSMTDQAKELGQQTSFSAREAADGMYELSTAGFKANEVMRIIPGTLSLAAASGTDLASAAELQATALRGFGLQANQANRVADVLTTTVNRSAVEMTDLGDSLKYVAPVARATGQSMESMLAALGLMGNVGVKGAQAGTTLRTALVRLTAPTTKSAKALADLGITGNELRGPKGLLPLPEILAKIVRGAQGMDKGTRNAAIAAIFGREALSGMIAMIDRGPGALERNIDALKRSEGQAKRTAKIMRDNVAGGWDQFTGSLETAAITLTERFGPALKNGLKGAASGVSAVTRFLGDVALGADRRSKGLPLTGPEHPAAGRGLPLAGANRAAKTDDPSLARKIGAGLANVAGTVGRAAMTAGAQLLDAFRPALPFFQNVLLPLLEGLGKGLLIGVVGAFKVLVPVIRGVSIVLGAIGTVAKPLAPVFRAVGTVIGVVFGGPIMLKAVELLGKLGFVGRAAAAGVRLLAIPVRLVGGLFGRLGSLVGSAIGKVVGAGSSLATKLIVTWALLPVRAANIAANIASRLIGGLRGAIGGVRSTGSKIASTLLGFLTGLPGRIGGAATSLVSSFAGLGARLGKGLVSAIIKAIAAAPGVVIDALKSLVPSPLRKAASAIFGGRRGGLVHRQDGGLIPSAVSPGELVTYGDSSWMVPGARSAADSVTTLLPAGAAVWTDHGQQLLAGGMDPASALGAQLPHFRAGGVVPGRYDSTAYGPPWGGINGTGVTATGINLRPARRLYGVAVDPNLIPLGQNVYAWPNPFRYTGPFRAFDTGGAIKGRHLDFYDWRGHSYQDKWGHKSTTISTNRLHGKAGDEGTYRAPGGAGSTVLARNLGRSRTRAGLVDDALAQGRAAGQAGLTRFEIAQAGRGVAGARVNPILEAIRGALTQPDTGKTASLREIQAAGGDPGKYPAGSHMGRMHARASSITSRHYQYAWGGGHGAIGRPSIGSLHANGKGPRGLGFDCSGAVSAVLGAGGFLRRPLTSGSLTKWGQAGAGQKISVLADSAHTIMRVGGRYFGTGGENPKGGAGWLTRNTMAGRGVTRHPPGFRRGGVVGPSLPGVGTALRTGVSSALQFAGGSLAALDATIGDAAELRIRKLRDGLVSAVRQGGPQRVVERLQSVITLIDSELGRRIGILEAEVDKRSAQLERSRGQFGRNLRRFGIDPDSTAGLTAAQASSLTLDEPAARANVRDLTTALNRAKRAHAGKDTIAEITDKLTAAQDDLDEVLVSQIERARQAIRQAAQDHVDAASWGLEVQQSGLSSLDALQRIQQTADTPAGMLQRAGAIRAGTIPALQALIAAQYGQYDAARATGDDPGARAADLAIRSSGVDLANAIADVADLTRQAAERAAQDAVDAAGSTTTLANSGLARLELEQKIAGTYDTGGVTRGQFIQTNVIPALQAELAALAEQERVARANGTAAELRAVIEAEAAKQNEILQASLDAQEDIAANTEPRKFGGTLAFSYGGETLTDSLIASGNGV